MISLAAALGWLTLTVVSVLGTGALCGLLIGDALNERDRRRATPPPLPHRNPYRGEPGARTVPPPGGRRPDRGP